MKKAFFALALLACGRGVATSVAAASDRKSDVAVVTEKKISVWPKFYAERDADGLDKFLADGSRVLEPDGSIRTKNEEITWLRETLSDEE